jgi:hypothetical protein
MGFISRDMTTQNEKYTQNETPKEESERRGFCGLEFSIDAAVLKNEAGPHNESARVSK